MGGYYDWSALRYEENSDLNLKIITMVRNLIVIYLLISK